MRKHFGNSQPSPRLGAMLAKLKARGFRLTPQRVAVVQVLASSEKHPSVAQVYEAVKDRFPTTSLATIYKTVDLLKELGEILELGFSDGRNRYDGRRPFPHPHLICLRCNDIVDPVLAGLDRFSREAARKTGYRILSHRLDFFGLCPACRKKSGGGSSRG